MPLRSEIESALDELISNEEGMRFQGVALVLAKQKWPELIASERKKDLGRDAYGPAILARNGKGRVLASSLTATIGKIKDDLERIRQAISDLAILIFYTPRPVTEEAKERWTTSIGDDYGVDLVIVSREDVVIDLMKPNNASICESMLGIRLAHEPELTDVIDRTRAAISEVIASWVRTSRLSGTPLIELAGVKLDEHGEETATPISTADVETALLENQRVMIEGPAGRGKTTTLIQLASRATGTNSRDLSFLINLPEFLSSRDSLLDFIAKMPAFLSRRITTANIAKVYENIHCSFLLNGWNEISDAYSEDAVHALVQIDRNFPAAGIVLATRTHHISPPLPVTLRVRLSPLSRAQRSEYVRQFLGETASSLLVQLERDRALDELTRIPLVLMQVAAIFRAGKPIPRTKMAVLNAMVGLIEGSDEHQSHLRRPPLAGNAEEYLVELAQHAVDEGEVIVSEASARTAVQNASSTLRLRSQIASLPEPVEILSLLCAHHVLERIEYPSVAFRFQHQQFQEFYAALALRRDLAAPFLSRDSAATSAFARDFINRPAWEVSLRMFAEELGQEIGQRSGHESLETAKQLIGSTLKVDPIFAADLSRLCGDRLWQEVGPAISERLRLWRTDPDSHHQQCALAGMLASGAPDFSDILLPLITNRDQQVRLRTYRAWHQFHVSSLGSNWKELVGTWDEDWRADFVGEIGRQRQATDAIEVLALEDPSARVRLSAAQALFFAGAPESLRRVLNGLDEALFQDLVRKGFLDSPPSDLRSRVLAAKRALLATAETPLARIGIMLSMAELGERCAPDDLFVELASVPSTTISNDQQWSLHSVLETLRKIDPVRVSQWVGDRIISGALSGSHWIVFVTSLSESQCQLLLDQIMRREVGPIEMHRLVELAAAANTELCSHLFLEGCAIESRLAPLEPNASERPRLATISRQIRDFLRKAPVQVAFAGILAALSSELVPTEYEFLVETFGSVGDEDFDLKAQLDGELRGRTRAYLLAGVSWVLGQHDYSGNLKAVVATALARIREPEDINVLRQLILADINRRRIGQEARLRGDRGPIGNGAVMSYSNWHIRAVCQLGPEGAEALLIELLKEQEYEQDAARGLLSLARTPARARETPIPLKPRDYARIWDARAERQPSGFDEERRHRSADVIRNRISELLGTAAGTDSAPLRFRAKNLAAVLAALDPKNSAELVLQTLDSQAQWDHWARVHALQAILFGGGELETQRNLEILQPVIEHTTHRLHDHQERYLLSLCLCILAFVNEPEAGIARIREILRATILYGFELRELIPALGNSRCAAALGALLDIATRNPTALRGAAVEWISAVNTLGTPEAKQVLLSFADPNTPSPRVQYHFEHHEVHELTQRIADLAQANSTITQRLFSLSACDLDPERRQLLIQVLAAIGTQDALIASLNIMRDDADPPIPFELAQALEAIFLEHRPYGESAYTYSIEPRSGREIRRRLFGMLIDDNNRRRSAWSMLGRIELWRVEYGRPGTEPRHPVFESGLPWPPLESQNSN
jgi:hypothetical protein